MRRTSVGDVDDLERRLRRNRIQGEGLDVRVTALEAVPAGRQLVVFTASGSFTKASYPGLVAVRVACVGAGGAGGGAPATAGGESSVGHGGGGGAYAESFILEAALATSETVTVGAGGAGASGAAGAGGADTSFGTHVIADAGGGGDVLAAGSTDDSDNGIGQAGTVAGSTGDIKIAGQYGHIAIRSATPGASTAGMGGASGRGWGYGGPPQGAAGDGIPGQAYGGGGGGAKNGTSSSARDGGDGADGVCVVELVY